MRAIFLSNLLVLALATGAAAGNFTKVNFHHDEAALLTVNNSGVAAGWYVTPRGEQHGLVRTPDGQVTAFAVRRARGTAVLSINDDGTVAGNYLDPRNSTGTAFIRSADGHIQTFAVPGNVRGTAAQAINAAGTVTGDYLDAGLVAHGIVRAPDGTITIFDVPNATNGTFPRAINGAGEIAGRWQDANGHYHGFLRATDGAITSFDAPGVGSYTNVAGIDGNGDVAGSFADTAGVVHGYVRDAAGAFHVFDAPDARLTSGFGTTPLGMSANGTVTGYYRDNATLNQFDFVRSPDGTIVEFAPRKGELSSIAWAVNDSGEVAGVYVSGRHDGKNFGFIGTP
jgi:hypothetical protein